MPKKDIKRYTKPDPVRVIIEREVRLIFNSFHACALSREQAASMGLSVGRLCDGCESSVQAHTQYLYENLREELS